MREGEKAVRIEREGEILKWVVRVKWGYLNSLVNIVDNFSLLQIDSLTTCDIYHGSFGPSVGPYLKKNCTYLADHCAMSPPWLAPWVMTCVMVYLIDHFPTLGTISL